MRTFGTEKNYAVWDNQVTEILLQERTTAIRFPIDPGEVMPRYMKAAEEQKSRTAKKAEVFTPYEIVKMMNDKTEVNYDGSVGDYIRRTVLEVTCGEAPFLTTRYDASTGVEIPVENRTGLLDRKLGCIPVAVGRDGYVECATAALQSAYGYEWQYDSLSWQEEISCSRLSSTMRTSGKQNLTTTRSRTGRLSSHITSFRWMVSPCVSRRPTFPP